MISLSRRLRDLELTVPRHNVERCMENLRAVLRLPLPDRTPKSVINIGLKKLLAIRECAVADRDKLTIEFRTWSDSIHEKFGAVPNGQS